MALEQVFECPRTLRTLRSDPLGKLLGGVCNWLNALAKGPQLCVVNNLKGA